MAREPYDSWVRLKMVSNYTFQKLQKKIWEKDQKQVNDKLQAASHVGRGKKNTDLGGLTVAIKGGLPIAISPKNTRWGGLSAMGKAEANYHQLNWFIYSGWFNHG